MASATINRTSYNKYGQKVTTPASTVYQMTAPQQASYSAPSLSTATNDVLGAFEQNKNQIFADSSELSNEATTQALSILERTMPGYSELMKSLSSSAQDDLNNRYTMPQEMVDSLRKTAAENNISRGTSGGFNQFSLIKDMGVNLLDYSNQVTQRAQGTLQTMKSLAPSNTVFSPFGLVGDVNQTLSNETQQAQFQTGNAQAWLNAINDVDNFNSRAIDNRKQSLPSGGYNAPTAYGNIGYQKYNYTISK